VIEQVVRFGPGGILVGVLTRPELAHGDAPARDVAVLLSNTGTNHRVGPFRINVELARAFARAGYATLRFDRSGLGDSAHRDAPGSDHSHALLDTQDAIGLLEERCGIARVALVALCSGVDVAHATTLADARVAGAAFIDGYAYPTRGFHARHRRRVLDLARLRRHFRRHRHRARHPEFFAAPPTDASRIFTREIPSAEQFRADVRTMTTRGAQLLLVYTGGMGIHINAPEQVREMLGDALDPARVGVAWMPEADHLFSRPTMRRALEQSLRRWLDRIDAS
jgi:hypothetical protein